MATDNTVFKATYSSVPVYEMPCKGVAVMKRRSDNWVNATQILKVAGFDKPQRTRVLEREVQKGTHEKVQGGYGKYQGTWVPPIRGVEISTQYGVLHLLQPIFDYVPPANGSPPPAPKHITAVARGPRVKKGTPAADGASSGAASPAAPAARARKESNKSGSLPPQGAAAIPASAALPPVPAPMHAAPRAGRPPKHEHPVYAESQLSRVEQFEDREPSPPLSENASSASRTPSPFGSDGPGAEYDDEYSEQQSAATGQRGSKRKHDQADLDGTPDDLLEGGQSGAAVYARMILDYFVSESAQIPSFLISPPADFDPNVVIDDDGHTALHWACAMGRIRIVKLLLTAGADIFRANAMGQTALMRSVMFTNNYDLRKFPELFELLHRSTINIDRNDRTVFHYVIDIALQKGKAHAARYYLEVILDRLKEYPREVSDILNFQDEEGETALTLAARARSKNLVRMLLNHGADGKIANRDGKSAEDYILEDERFKNSNDEPALDPRGIDEGFPAETYAEPAQEQYPYAHEPLQPVLSGPPYPEQRQPVQPVTSNGYYAVPVPTLGAGPSRLHFSESGQRVTAQIAPQINSRLEALAATFDAELEEREKDIAQAHALILGIEAESVESARVASELQSQASGLGEAREREAQLQLELKDRLGKRFRLGWEKYVRDEEERQKAFVGISKGDGKATILGEAPADVEGIFGALPANGSDELAAAVKASADRLATLKAHRKELCDSFVQIQMEAGTADSKVNEYRKLIALGCGIAVDEVDAEFISTVLEQLDNGEEAV